MWHCIPHLFYAHCCSGWSGFQTTTYLLATHISLSLAPSLSLSLFGHITLLIGSLFATFPSTLVDFSPFGYPVFRSTVTLVTRPAYIRVSQARPPTTLAYTT
jgi:hypothetical protein